MKKKAASSATLKSGYKQLVGVQSNNSKTLVEADRAQISANQP